jgi:hypothetical protein
VCAALTNNNSQILNILPGTSVDITSHVKEQRVIVYIIFGRELRFPNQFYNARLDGKEFAEKFCKLLSDVLLPRGLLKPDKVTKIPGGVNGVNEWKIR